VNKKLKSSGILVFRIFECLLKTHPRDIVSTIKHRFSLQF
jgi:hypothetical protein